MCGLSFNSYHEWQAESDFPKISLGAIDSNFPSSAILVFKESSIVTREVGVSKGLDCSRGT